MSKVFTAKEFIDKLKWLVYDVPNVYYSGSQWSKLNSYGQWQFDCVVSIKSILWGFRADRNALRGGTVYCSNGVPDFTCNGALNYCTNVSTDFRNLIPGEYLCMKDTKYNHSGIYIGNGKVFECTTGWGTRKCIISDISSNGTRSLNGSVNLRWTYHGMLNYIDYGVQPDPSSDVSYQTYDNRKNKWLPRVYVGDYDYAGNYGNPVSGLRIFEDIEYMVHDKVKGYWLPIVRGSSDYAGNLPNDIDGVAIKSDKYKYQVHLLKENRWLPFVDGFDVNDWRNGYAGNLGQVIDAIRIEKK